MARPIKNYCDYFSHDRDMRNHRKIKAIRAKFGISGYGIWCMLLEYLTGIEGNSFEYSEIEMELISGDFGVSVTEIRQVVDYCIRLELLFLNDGILNSKSLDDRLKPVYDKRELNKGKSKQQSRSGGKFTHRNNGISGVSVTEIPQSKVKESKENTNTVLGTKVPVDPLIDGADEGGRKNADMAPNSTKSSTIASNIKTVPNHQKEISGEISASGEEIKKKPKKTKKDPDAEPYWKDLVKVYFSFCHEKFGEKPSFDGGAPSAMHRIVEKLRCRSVEKEVEWTQEEATLRWREFLGRAYQFQWLRENWLLANLNKQKDKIFFNVTESRNGTTQHPSSTVGKTIEFD